GNHVDPPVDADGSTEGNHFLWNVPEYAMPRVLPSSGFSAVQISRFMAYSRLLRASRRVYHHARDTAPKRLFWVPVAGGRWRIDWPRTNRGARLRVPSMLTVICFHFR